MLPVVAVSAFALQSPSLPTLPTLNPKDMTIWHIGSSPAVDTVLDMANLRGSKTNSLDIQHLNSNATLESAVLSKSSVIMFDDTALNQGLNNDELHKFLNQAASKVGGITAIGEQTSTLCDILDKAGVYTLPRYDNGTARNPFSNNPQVVGFVYKQATTQDGESYYYPSIFKRPIVDSDIAQEIASWIGRLN